MPEYPLTMNSSFQLQIEGPPSRLLKIGERRATGVFGSLRGPLRLCFRRSFSFVLAGKGAGFQAYPIKRKKPDTGLCVEFQPGSNRAPVGQDVGTEGASERSAEPGCSMLATTRRCFQWFDPDADVFAPTSISRR